MNVQSSLIHRRVAFRRKATSCSHSPHHLGLLVALAHRVAQVPAHTQYDDFGVVVPPAASVFATQPFIVPVLPKPHIRDKEIPFLVTLK
ncbi:MAG: hypothetical protein JOZ78_09660 [Chroococcidiopsidaceae cyanobacterium CP_BM_ER_R8_30]|nr:hypothetical protein [Chroococcidiopsidaceae cyanobacterium CP_BM_ER_R8_30]